jgi:hypothetical protein
VYNTAKFVHALQLLHQFDIIDEVDLQNKIDLFMSWFQDYFYKQDHHLLSSCKVNDHQFLHAVQSFRYIGSLRSVWQYCIEDYLGSFKGEFKNRNHIHQNIANRILLNMHLRSLETRYPEFKTNEVSIAEKLEKNRHIFLKEERNLYLLERKEEIDAFKSFFITQRITPPTGTVYVKRFSQFRSLYPHILGSELCRIKTGRKETKYHHQMAVAEMLYDKKAHFSNVPEDLSTKKFYFKVFYYLEYDTFKLALVREMIQTPYRCSWDEGKNFGITSLSGELGHYDVIDAT